MKEKKNKTSQGREAGGYHIKNCGAKFDATGSVAMAYFQKGGASGYRSFCVCVARLFLRSSSLSK